MGIAKILSVLLLLSILLIDPIFLLILFVVKTRSGSQTTNCTWKPFILEHMKTQYANLTYFGTLKLSWCTCVPRPDWTVSTHHEEALPFALGAGREKPYLFKTHWHKVMSEFLQCYYVSTISDTVKAETCRFDDVGLVPNCSGFDNAFLFAGHLR